METVGSAGFSLHLEVGDAGLPSILAVRGEIDAHTAPEIERAATTLISSQAPIIIELSAVEFIDSAGINTLVKLGRSSAGRLAMAAPQPSVRRRLSISGLDRLVEIYATAGEAAEALIGRASAS